MPYTAGVETASVNVAANGLLLAANAGRVLVIIQNCGTAIAGISTQTTTPVALTNCAIRLAPASADGGADGDTFIINWTKEAIGLFCGTGTKNVMVTEVV